MTRAEELANDAFLTKDVLRLRPEMQTLHGLVVKAIRTYGEEVRRQDADIARNMVADLRHDSCPEHLSSHTTAHKIAAKILDARL